MRTFVYALARLAAVVPAVLALPSSVIAGPVPVAAAVRLAGDSLMIEKVACWGYGWRGWGIYPSWRPACGGAWVAPGYVVTPPVYAPVAPVAPVPAAGRCWVPAGRDGQPGYWAVC